MDTQLTKDDFLQDNFQIRLVQLTLHYECHVFAIINVNIRKD